MSADLTGVFDGVGRVLVPGIDDVARFEEPARGEPGRAALVVQPATVDEVRAVVSRAHRYTVRLLPQGANTGLIGASVPPADPPTVVLSTDLLHGPAEIDPDAATATVTAGTRLSELNERAAAHGLQLPIDLAADPAIGGMIATNTGGSRVLRYGPMRRYVLGVELVAADQDASLCGQLSRLRKDSRGLDPVHVAVGSGGTLGVITRAVVSLVPLPQSLQTWWLAVDDPARVIELLTMFEQRRRGAVSAFEFVSRPAYERTVATPGTPANPFGITIPSGAVLAEWSLDHDEVANVEADIDAAFAAGLISDGRLVDPKTAWTLRHAVTESLRTYGVVVGHDVSVPRSTLMRVRQAAIDSIAELAPHAVVCDFGHAGDGGLHVNVLFPREGGSPDAELRAAIRNRVDELVAAHGGSYSAEHGLGPLNADRWLATTPPIEQQLVAGIKAVVDPRRILGHPGHPYNRLNQRSGLVREAPSS